MLVRVIVYIVVTSVCNIICWAYGVLFSAVYPGNAYNWLYCSIIVIIISFLILQLFGVLIKAVFRQLARSNSNP
jgi:hypothetical protein